MARRGSGPADINLTLGIDPVYSARRIANEMTQGFKQAGNQAGLDYNESFTAQVDKLEPRVSRAMRKVSTALLQVDEASAKVATRFTDAQLAQENLTKATDEYNRIAKDTTATQDDLARAHNDLAEAQRKDADATRALIADRARLNRANQATANSLALVNKSLSDIADEESAGQTLLSAGKFISALRAVAIPAVGSIAAIGGAGMITSLAAVSQGLWMIPAGAGAATAAFGSLKIATLGFSDAIEDMGDPEKFYEALQNLSPNAQQAALAIQALTEPLKQLKNATQDALFADVSTMLNQLAQQYLPMVQQMTTGIAGAFNNAMSGVFDQLMTPQTQAVLQNTIDNLVEAFQRLAPAAGPFVDAITRTVQTGASFLPGMADSITKAAEGFAKFITEAQESGKLEEWMRDGIKAVGQMWDGVKLLAKAFADLAPAGQKALPDIIELLKTMGNTLPPILSGLTGILKPIGEIANAFNMMWSVVGPIINKFTSAVDNLSGKIGMLTNNPLFNNPIFRTFVGAGLPAGVKMPWQVPGSTNTTPRSGDPSKLPLAGGNDAAAAILGNAATGSGLGNNVDDMPTTDAPDPSASAVAPVPSGGYPMPPPPPDKASGSGGSKADEPPFTADPSLYSLDAIPAGAFFGGSGAGAPLAAEAPMIPAPNLGAIPQLLGTNPAISLIGALAEQAGLTMISGIAGPNSPTGRAFDGGFHDSGQAGDFSNGPSPTPEMRGVAMWLASNFGGLIEELIYNDDFGGVGIKSGMPVDANSFYGPNDHRNHIHLAVRDELVPAFVAAVQQNMFGGAAGGGGYMSIDQQAISRAENDRLAAKEAAEEARLRLLELEAKGDATQLQLLTARNNVLQADRRFLEADQKLQEERLGTYKKFDSDFTKTAQQAVTSLGQVGAQLADDFGLSEGLPGIAKWLTTFLANLAFAPAVGALSAVSASSPYQGGHGLLGMMGAQNMAAGMSPLGLSMGAPTAGGLPMAAPFAPLGAVAPGAAAMGPAPLGGGLGMPLMGGAAPMAHGAGMGAAPGPVTPNTSQAPAGNPGGGGFQGLGGMPMQAVSSAMALAAPALNAMMPGAGQAAQIGVQLANRTAGYLGQLGAIGVGGLLETFLPNNSAAADPSKSWLGKIAAGFAGARPALPNTAGTPAPAQPGAAQPQQGAGGPAGPMVQVGSIINQTPDGGQSLANQIARMGMASHASGMGR